MIGIGPIDVTPILELRERYEHRVDRDFSDRTDDGLGDLFGRYRAGLGFRKGTLSGQIVYQYGHDEDWNANRNLALWRSDLILAFAQAKTPLGTATLGRQRLAFGSERLLGVRDWSNVTYAWDGGRLSAPRLDLFVVKSGVLPTPDETVSLYGGAYAGRAGQTLAIVRRETRLGENDLTVDQLYRATFGPVRFEAEAAGQVGHRGGRNVLAGALESVATVPVAPRLTFSAQASLASGGRRTGTSNTFDPLYPSTHDHYGLMDLAQWENLRALGAWLSFAPERRTGLKLQYHHLELDSARDAWYTVSGTPYRRPGGTYLDPTGSRGRDLGDEVDLDASRTLDAHQSVRAGFGVFQPGHFVRSFNGGATDHQTWGYVQYTYRF